MAITEAAQRGIDRFGEDFRATIDFKMLLDPLLNDADELLGPMDFNEIKDEIASRTRALPGDAEMKQDLENAACALQDAENNSSDIILKLNALFDRFDYYRIKVLR